MRFLRQISIKHKLVWILMLTSGAALLLAGSAVVTYDVFAFRDSLVRDLGTLSRIVADNCTGSLRFDNADDARAILRTLQFKPHVVSGYVFANDETLFAAYERDHGATNRPPPKPWREGHQFRDGHLEVIAPIALQNERLGSVFLRSDLEELSTRLKKYSAVVLVVVIFSVGIALLLSAQLQKLISGPVLHLAQTARTVSGEKNFSVRAVKSTEDELGELIDAFNDMLAQIQQRDTALQDARDELELRVQQRTQELQHEVVVRQQAEAAARASELKFRSLIESANDAIILADVAGKIVLWNTGAVAIFGYAEEEIVGKPLTAIMPQSYREGHLRGLERLQTTGVTHVIGKSVELQGLRKDGSIFPLDLSLSTWNLGNNTFYGGIIRDISERKQTYEQLKLLADKLERSNRELQAFAYVASHDLQEPLRKVQAFGDRLKATAGSVLSEESRDYLARMLNAAKRMQTLINDLLLFSRVSTQTSPFQPVNLGQIARDVLSDLEVRIQQTGGRVELDELPTIEADPLQMRQLFQNVISNALKFFRTGVPPLVKIQSEMLPGPDDTSAENTPSDAICRVLIVDNGIGFEEKYLDRIFGVFQRLHSRQDYEGTGIGLAICRKIVERHRGTITARSRPDHGATFILTLPVRHTNLPHES